MSLRYIKPSDSERRGELFREFTTPLASQLQAIRTWVGHAERHLAAGEFQMARVAFSQIEDAADAVNTRLTDLAAEQRLQRQSRVMGEPDDRASDGSARWHDGRDSEPDPPDHFGGPSCDTRHRDVVEMRDEMDSSEGFGYWPGEDNDHPNWRMRRRA